MRLSTKVLYGIGHHGNSAHAQYIGTKIAFNRVPDLAEFHE
jgi:hypothetical protein